MRLPCHFTAQQHLRVDKRGTMIPQSANSETLYGRIILCHSFLSLCCYPDLTAFENIVDLDPLTSEEAR